MFLPFPHCHLPKGKIGTVTYKNTECNAKFTNEKKRVGEGGESQDILILKAWVFIWSVADSYSL